MDQLLNLDQMGLKNMSFEDTITIDGGDYDSGYAAGNAAGAYVRNIFNGVSLLSTGKAILEALEIL